MPREADRIEEGEGGKSSSAPETPIPAVLRDFAAKAALEAASGAKKPAPDATKSVEELPGGSEPGEAFTLPLSLQR